MPKLLILQINFGWAYGTFFDPSVWIQYWGGKNPGLRSIEIEQGYLSRGPRTWNRPSGDLEWVEDGIKMTLDRMIVEIDEPSRWMEFRDLEKLSNRRPGEDFWGRDLAEKFGASLDPLCW